MSYTASLIVIPHRILYLEGVQLSYIKVYEHIFHLWNQRKPCFIGNPEFCERTGLALSTVQEALAFFEEKGELKRLFRGRKRYLIQPELSIEIEPDDLSKSDHPPEIADSSHPSQQIVATRDSRPYKDIRCTNPNITNLNKNSCASDDARAVDNNPFEVFWEAYPKKTGKKAALKAWTKNKLDQHANLIITDINRRKAQNWFGKDKQYLPDPASYLNGERWNDELFTSTGGNPHAKRETASERMARKLGECLPRELAAEKAAGIDASELGYHPIHEVPRNMDAQVGIAFPD